MIHVFGFDDKSSITMQLTIMLQVSASMTVITMELIIMIHVFGFDDSYHHAINNNVTCFGFDDSHHYAINNNVTCAGIAGSNPTEGMDVCCECVFAGTVLCDGPNLRPGQ